jgi:hypothetical protein
MLKARGPRRRAERRPLYPATGPCNCAVCVEKEHLHDIASWHPHMQARVLAMTFIGALDAVRLGRSGAVEMWNLFD